MWYEGTADAVYQNIDIVESYGVEYVVVLAGTTSTRWTMRSCSGSSWTRVPT